MPRTGRRNLKINFRSFFVRITQKEEAVYSIFGIFKNQT
jgi:hypothetical protein